MDHDVACLETGFYQCSHTLAEELGRTGVFSHVEDPIISHPF